MSIFHNNVLLGASGNQGADTGYQIDRSLRFNSADSAYLSRGSFANSDTKTMTFSFWLKRSALTATKATQYIFSGGDNGTIFFDSGNGDKLSFNLRGTSGSNFFTTTSAQLRDLSAWYHIVVALDLDNSTTSERFKCYINGVQQTMSNTSYPNNSFHDGGTWYIGSYTGSDHYPDYYLAEFHYVAGQALAATNFGEYDDNNNWNPKEYSGSYGTNGFYLDFSDNSSTSALGTDSSGNSNTWTVNNIVAAQTAAAHIATGGDPASSTTNPFGSGQGHSVEFDGSGDQLRFTGPGLVDGDLTVECFYRMDTDASGYQRIFSTKEDSYSSEQTMIRRHTNGNLQFYFGNGSPEDQGGSISGNTWYHAAIVYDKSAATVSYYLDGSRLDTDSYEGTVRITEMVVGGGYSSENWKGLISNCRVTKQALYSGTSYTVPTSTLTTTSQGATAANVALLCCTTSTITAASGTSGNANDIDSMIDSPTNYTADSGNNGGNYCTLNPLSQSSGTLSQGNLRYDLGSGTRRIEGTMAVKSGKWYWEALAISGTTNGTVGGRFGITIQTQVDNPEQGPYNLSWHSTSGIQKFVSGSASTLLTGTNYGDGDLLGLALDADNNIAYFYKNGSLAYTRDFSADIAAGSQFLTPVCWNGSSGTPVWHYNFGQRGFDHTPRTNHVSLCTANFDTPTIADGSTVFDIFSESGTGADRTFTMPGGFGPDFVWTKELNATTNNALFDIVRGATKRLVSNSRNDEDTQATQLKSFTSTGFTYGDDIPNGSGDTGVYWCWDAGTTTDTNNTNGSITPAGVRASQSAGFSIIEYTGTGSNGTVGHGLSLPPDWIIFKDINRDDEPWFSWHSVLGNEAYLFFNTGAAKSTGNSDFMNSTSPTNSVFSVGNATGKQNRDGSNFLALCWHNVEGYSLFGSYIGNESTDGGFVYTGFRPAWLLWKVTASNGNSGNWYVIDSTRDPSNETVNRLHPNTTADEAAMGTGIDLLSNGFKIRSADTDINKDDLEYVFAAFAEHPFKTSRAR